MAEIAEELTQSSKSSLLEASGSVTDLGTGAELKPTAARVDETTMATGGAPPIYHEEARGEAR